jgi:transcriptional regulator with XRE-family HTH domain
MLDEPIEMGVKSPVEIGHTLRAHRKRRQLTLEQLADLSKVSKSMISLIERGESSPTFAALWRITFALGISLGELTMSPEFQSPPPAELIPAADTPELQSRDGLCRVRILSPLGLAHSTQWFELEFQAGGTLASEAHRRGSWEHLTALSGGLTVTSGDSILVLEKGATARYPADVPHSIRNMTDEPQLAILVSYHIDHHW